MKKISIVSQQTDVDLAPAIESLKHGIVDVCKALLAQWNGDIKLEAYQSEVQNHDGDIVVVTPTGQYICRLNSQGQDEIYTLDPHASEPQLLGETDASYERLKSLEEILLHGTLQNRH